MKAELLQPRATARQPSSVPAQRACRATSAGRGDWNRRDWEAWKAKHHGDMVQLMLEPWEEQRLEIDDMEVHGNVVTVRFRWVAKGRGSQLRVDMPLVGKYTVTDGKIERMVFFLESDGAPDASPPEQPR